MNNKFIKYPLILLVVGGLCAAAISLTYMFTQPVLEARQAETTKKNISQLYNNVDKYKTLYNENQLEDDALIEVYEVSLKDKTNVIVYQTSSVGKNGEVISLVAFKDNKIDRIKNIIHNETPGIGARIDEEDYLNKIIKQDIKNINVETISGATYSSTALKNSVETAAAHYNKEVAK